MGLFLYQGENDGGIPDGETANEVFRSLIVEGHIDSESVFGCRRSDFVPDGKFGNPPSYERALEPGENHWMMVVWPEGTERKRSKPFIIEAADMSMGAPLWHPWEKESTAPGRTWTSNRLIVVMGDGSVSTYKIEGEESTSKIRIGRTVFDFADPLIRLLPVE